MDIIAAGIQTVIQVSQEVTSLRRVSCWWNTAGWPVGVSFAAALATITLFVNLVAIIGISIFKDYNEGIAELYRGDCKRVSTLDTWVHVGINILSSLLLGGSNYCMQILIAPTRSEIDEAHRQGKWLDIGIPSMRNLRRVRARKAYMWWLLGLSSLPLHLVYNSTFFETIGINEYDVILADKSFLTNEKLDIESARVYGNFSTVLAFMEDWQEGKTWKKLNREECIDAYATEFLSERSNLVAIIDNSSTPTNRSVQYVHEYNYESFTQKDFYDWICHAPDGDSRYGWKLDEFEEGYGNRLPCTSLLPNIRLSSDKWNVEGWDIDYCLSELQPGRCTWSFSRTLGIVVIFCNLGKCITMLAVVFYVRDTPLTTIGDAIRSFLDTNDPSTGGMCLLSKGLVRRNIWRKRLRHANLRNIRSVRKSKSILDGDSRRYIKPEALVLKYEPEKKRWSKSVGCGRWAWFIVL